MIFEKNSKYLTNSMFHLDVRDIVMRWTLCKYPSVLTLLDSLQHHANLESSLVRSLPTLREHGLYHVPTNLLWDLAPTPPPNFSVQQKLSKALEIFRVQCRIRHLHPTRTTRKRDPRNRVSRQSSRWLWLWRKKKLITPSSLKL
jgi:hypothetical protein